VFLAARIIVVVMVVGGNLRRAVDSRHLPPNKITNGIINHHRPHPILLLVGMGILLRQMVVVLVVVALNSRQIPSSGTSLGN
jgi:hypothetical protein